GEIAGGSRFHRRGWIAGSSAPHRAAVLHRGRERPRRVRRARAVRESGNATRSPEATAQEESAPPRAWYSGRLLVSGGSRSLRDRDHRASYRPWRISRASERASEPASAYRRTVFLERNSFRYTAWQPFLPGERIGAETEAQRESPWWLPFWMGGNPRRAPVVPASGGSDPLTIRQSAQKCLDDLRIGALRLGLAKHRRRRLLPAFE